MSASAYLHKAFLLAGKAHPKKIRPNPFVGALVVSNDGQVLGEGYHEKAGEAHAEVIAIKNAIEHGADLSTCTLYVTLEPCSHTGKTPPCTDLIIHHRIPKVVIGSMDPNPLVSGVSKLRENGIAVEVHSLPEIIELNDTFNINQQLKRPKYVLKTAMTLNGKIADRWGNSKWLSSAESRDYVHRYLRTAADAILTSAKTVLKDNARMNIRIPGKEDQELSIVVIDRNLDVLKKENNQLLLFYKREKSKIYLVTDQPENMNTRADIDILTIPWKEGQVQLELLHATLLQKNICQVLIEAGSALNASFMLAGCVDEILAFVCPKLLLDNESTGLFNSKKAQKIEDIVTLKFKEGIALESDILLRYSVDKKDNFIIGPETS